MLFKLLLSCLLLVGATFCMAQDNNDVDCGPQHRYNHTDYPPLSEDTLELIGMMRSAPPLYHNAGVRMEASRRNLNEVDLHNLSFEYAQFFSSSLEKVNLQKARVIGAVFTSANLQKANLQEINVRNANFSVANLCQANLARANLRGASLSGGNLRYSSLRFANLAMADMTRVDLTGADLTGAVLVGALLDSKTVTIEQLATTASLHNVILEKQGYEDKVMLDILKELHPHLFDEIPLNIWFRPSQHFPNAIQNWYYSR